MTYDAQTDSEASAHRSAASGAPAGGTPWRELQSESLAAMSADERAAYDAAAAEEELRLQIAELVYNARRAAGLSQAALAARAGTHQSVISAIENGAQVPTVQTLMKLARALGSRLHIDLDAA